MVQTLYGNASVQLGMVQTLYSTGSAQLIMVQADEYSALCTILFGTDSVP